MVQAGMVRRVNTVVFHAGMGHPVIGHITGGLLTESLHLSRVQDHRTHPHQGVQVAHLVLGFTPVLEWIAHVRPAGMGVAIITVVWPVVMEPHVMLLTI